MHELVKETVQKIMSCPLCYDTVAITRNQFGWYFKIEKYDNLEDFQGEAASLDETFAVISNIFRLKIKGEDHLGSTEFVEFICGRDPNLGEPIAETEMRFDCRDIWGEYGRDSLSPIAISELSSRDVEMPQMPVVPSFISGEPVFPREWFDELTETVAQIEISEPLKIVNGEKFFDAKSINIKYMYFPSSLKERLRTPS